jgi:hypothetical protein
MKIGFLARTVLWFIGGLCLGVSILLVATAIIVTFLSWVK